MTEGVYSEPQADRGHEAYYQNCAYCHGAALTGGEAAPPLAGGEFLSNWNGATVGDLFERIRTTMPPDHPGLLSRETSADILAFILRFNRFPAASAELDQRTEALKQIRIEMMPEGPPNPYVTVKNFLKMPEGRTWGSTSAVFVTPSNHIWVAERCGENSCAGKTQAPVLEFDSTGKLVKSFGSGLFIFPHGIFVDREENVWIADGQGSGGIGHQVIKFSSDGKVLMRLGKAGVAGSAPGEFNQPNAVAVAPNGDIFVAEGHSPATGSARIQKFSKDGTFLKQWGGHGTGPGQFEMPHGLAFDSRGRLLVADRGNDRVQIFDQDGKFISQLPQFGRPSGIWVDSNDLLYVADSESRELEGYGHHPGWKRGIRIGSLQDGIVRAFIPDSAPYPETASTTGAEGVAVDPAGNVYGAEVMQKDVKRYERK